MKKEIDYKIVGKKRIRCPQCGKLGVARHYNDNSNWYPIFHKIQVIQGIPTITKSCNINKSEHPI